MSKYFRILSGLDNLWYALNIIVNTFYSIDAPYKVHSCKTNCHTTLQFVVSSETPLLFKILIPVQLVCVGCYISSIHMQIRACRYNIITWLLVWHCVVWNEAAYDVKCKQKCIKHLNLSCRLQWQIWGVHMHSTWLTLVVMFTSACEQINISSIFS